MSEIDRLRAEIKALDAEMGRMLLHNPRSNEWRAVLLKQTLAASRLHRLEKAAAKPSDSTNASKK